MNLSKITGVYEADNKFSADGYTHPLFRSVETEANQPFNKAALSARAPNNDQYKLQFAQPGISGAVVPLEHGTGR